MCDHVLLATDSWSSWSGVAGVIRRARVRWAMGSSVSAVPVSILFLVISVGGMMSNLGAERGGVFMTCNLGACAGEDGR